MTARVESPDSASRDRLTVTRSISYGGNSSAGRVVKLTAPGVDNQGMRLLLATFVILSLAGSLGCSIMDELDGANEKMDKFSNTKDKQEEAADDDGDQPLSPQARASKWWSEARSLDSEPMAESIVRCRLHGTNQFMRRDECLNRGGKPLDVSS